MTGGPRRGSRHRAAAALLAGSLVLAGCSGTPGGDRTADSGGDGQVLTVYAAASLAGPFTELARSYEFAVPGTTVRLNFAGSAELATQILAGAPADVFASADSATMERVDSAGELGGAPRDFATNVPALVVPAGNPAGIAGLADLEDDGVALVMCAQQVPCGAAAHRLALANAVSLRPVSEENSVTAVLAKVRTGEADAGLVYRTDVVRGGGDVEAIPVPQADEAAVTYPIAATRRGAETGRGQLAAGFIEHVAGPKGRAALEQAGFGTP
ncbi:molybdate ABC transporter [Arthrobacter crystallopoietes BAB-32]|uniref:Molybdate ABC transporter n=1 Tax=Arthrobacter crystallopoietes BAB-32 TaxID=1246476 RepID=N1UXN9_9MICC|nr:molybdate ABC transporter substrate-binding protein [Arthrobacter crystallopoietes]EMY35166.1 molybdate ABC transporter [Arthrobacter crystallopoietes BAB-32]